MLAPSHGHLEVELYRGSLLHGAAGAILQRALQLKPADICLLSGHRDASLSAWTRADPDAVILRCIGVPARGVLPETSRAGLNTQSASVRAGKL